MISVLRSRVETNVSYSSLAQQFTLHVTCNASQQCSDMHEAYDYFAHIYNGGLGVQVLPAKVLSSNVLIDEKHPLNQDDLILAVHPSGRVSIEREPPDDNSWYPLGDLPPYAYHQAVENFARSRVNNNDNRVRVVAMAPPPGAIVIEDSDSTESDDGNSYDYPGDLSQLSTESYDEIATIDQALTLSMTEQ